MKRYFFRDLNHEDNLLNGKTHHSAGYVNNIYKPSGNGKDLAVTMLNPFELTVSHEWRSIDEVEIFEVDEWEYDNAVKFYSLLEKFGR